MPESIKHCVEVITTITSEFPFRTFSILVRYGNKYALLLDCGPSIADKLFKLGISTVEINYVIISHQHGDHILGFPILTFARYAELNNLQQEKGSKRLQVIANQETVEQCLRITKEVFPGEADMFPVTYICITAPCSIKLDDFCTIEARNVMHTVPAIGVRLELSFSHGLFTIAFSGDTRPCESMIHLARNADLLIHDVFCEHTYHAVAEKWGHTTAYEAGILAQKAGVKQIMMINQWYKYRDQEALQKLEKEISEHFDGKVITPKDMSIFRF